MNGPEREGKDGRGHVQPDLHIFPRWWWAKQHSIIDITVFNSTAGSGGCPEKNACASLSRAVRVYARVWHFLSAFFPLPARI